MEVQTVQAVVMNDRKTINRDIVGFARDIKLSHSIFALPFVGVAMTLTGIPGVSIEQIFKIVVCMVLARSFAMGMNRYLDRNIDGANSRTKNRAIPSGAVNPSTYLVITIACGFGFTLVSFSLSGLAGALSPVLLAVLAFYSFMKKISWLTHWYLGICLGLAPLAAEIALFNQLSAPVVLVGAAVAAWTAGFDLLYSLQDREFDLEFGLHSVPSRLGHRAAIWLSRVSFLLMMVALFFAGQLGQCGVFWYIGVISVGLILTAEHWIVREAMVTGSSPKINVAFFNLNALVSVLFFGFAVVDAYVKK